MIRAGAATGQIAALICWLVTCSQTEGAINVDNLGADYPMLAGNVAALGVSLIVTTILSYTHGEDFDWEIMRQGIRMIEVDGTDKLADEGADSAEGLDKALTYAFCLFCTLSLELFEARGLKLLGICATVLCNNSGYVYWWRW